MTELTDLNQLPVYVITILVLAVGALFWENQKLNAEIRATLKEVFPAIQALQSALDFMKARE